MVSNSKPASGSTRGLMDSSETFTAWAWAAGRASP